MRIYRVEHVESGVGPYTTCIEKATDIILKYFNPRNQPLPQDDGLIDYDGLWFGFESRRQLTDWFPHPILPMLERLGFKVMVYEVALADMKRGRRQVAFVKENAVRLNEEVSY